MSDLLRLSPATDVDDAVVVVLSNDPAAFPGALDATWVVDVTDRRRDRTRIVESIAAVSDGLVGTRGNLEEDGVDSAPGVMVAGAYVADARTGQASIHLPSWALLTFRRPIDPGTRL